MLYVKNHVFLDQKTTVFLANNIFLDHIVFFDKIAKKVQARTSMKVHCYERLLVRLRSSIS